MSAGLPIVSSRSMSVDIAVVPEHLDRARKHGHNAENLVSAP